MRQPDHWWHGPHCPFSKSATGDTCTQSRSIGLFLLSALWRPHRGTASAADGVALRIQPRRPADPGRELLPLPRARQRRPQGRPAPRPARGRHQGRRHRAGRPRGERADRPDQRRRSQGGDAPAVDHQDAEPDAERRAQAVDRRGRRVSAALVAHSARSGPRCRRSRIDRGSATRSIGFVLAKLEENGLSPAPEADRRTLARRLSLDLTGLPPDPADVEAFVERLRRPTPTRSSSPGCSPRPAGASIAPATGSTPPATPTRTAIHFDNFREIWAYRDWVIGAFNRNLPFDRFTDRATRRRPAARPHARPAGRLGLQPLQHDDQRRRLDPRGIPGPLHPRPHRDRLAGLARPDGRLRGLPRPQVRPAQPARVLRAVGVLQQHDPAGHGRQHQGHAADRLRSRAPPTSRAGKPCPASSPTSANSSTLASSRPSPISRNGWPRPIPSRSRAMIPTDGLKLAAVTPDAPVTVQCRQSDRVRRRRRLRKGPGVLVRRLGQAAQGRA